MLVNLEKIRNEIKLLLNDEKIKFEITELKSVNVFHSTIRVVIPHGNFIIQGMESGCGLALMHGFYTNITSEILIKTFKIITNYYKIDGVGSIIAVLGQNFNDKFLLDCGFKLLTTYPNYRHGSDGNYKQRLYQLIL